MIGNINNNNNNNNKKLFKIIAIALLGSIIILCVFMFIRNIKDSKNDDEIEKPTKYIQKVDLPSLSEIDRESNPMLYDFVNSSLGYQYHQENEFTDYGFFYAILINNKNFNNQKRMYIEYYSDNGYSAYPKLGTAPKNMDLNDQEIKQIDNFRSKVSKNRIIKEGDYSLYIITRYGAGIATNDSANDNDNNNYNSYNYCDGANRWAGLDFNDLKLESIDNYGQMYYTIYENGIGWPTEWLKLEPFKTNLINEGYDITNSFWNKYNIGSYKIYLDTTDNNKEYKVYVEQFDRFRITYKDNTFRLNEEQLNQFLETYKWSEK